LDRVVVLTTVTTDIFDCALTGEKKIMDMRLYWTGIVYFVGMVLLHVAWWQALIIAATMTACWYLSYSQRVIRAVGVIVLMLGLFTWSGLLPPPSHWSPLLSVVERQAPPVGGLF
jgi:hypothetical protein